jgi:hypothetical protein
MGVSVCLTEYFTIFYFKQYIDSCIFWDITLSSSLEMNGSFGGAFCFHLHCRKISQIRNQREACSKL